jgi:formylglycine-generating enzyme required for sulfatase activity
VIELAGGELVIGSDEHYPEERPARTVVVAPFAIDPHPVTNADFARFVAETGWVTAAERGPDPSEFPEVDPALLVPGSAVFVMPPGPVDLDRPTWWAWCPGAYWRYPNGPDARPAEPDHPVVHLTVVDAEAYAAWCGKALPTEAQWEFAARAGGAPHRGYDPPPGVNVWRGEFPWRHDDRPGTWPVSRSAPNAYGLFDMIGNVWEWTADAYGEGPTSPCCGPGERRFDPSRRVVKGGSFLCASNYCARYRPAARLAQDVATSTVHIGMRCVTNQGGTR